jgi:predicted alpha-1,2-mannosidase
MAVLFQDRLGEILQAWVHASREGGWLPQFPAPGYRACMTGSLIDAVFGDAAAKKIPGFDLETAFAALKKHATTPGNPDLGYGRQGIEQYLKLGYAPADHVGQSVAETVDAAYGDFCIAQVAKALGKVEDAATFEARSKNWRHLFDPQVKFLRGKNADGQWLAPFDPVQWGSPYVEGSAWQHRWDAPHDAEGLIEAMGGEAFVAEQLEKMCTMPTAFKVGVYNTEIHEISEMAAVDFGQYAHSNQPVHHVLYLFALAGRADRTQYWVRKVMNELYTPETFAGDEDTGSMSAWYILSSCGFYSFCPGKPEYVLGSPLFDKVTLTPERGKALKIVARNNSEKNVFVRQVQLNGVSHTHATISHQALSDGGTLEFTMSPTASSKG